MDEGQAVTVREVSPKSFRAKCLACGARLEYADGDPFDADFEHGHGRMVRHWTIRCVRCRELVMLDAVTER